MIGRQTNAGAMPGLTAGTAFLVSFPPLCRLPTRRNQTRRVWAGAEELDPIEKAVGWLFGKQAVHNRKPFGLARLEGAALEQQYEANSVDQAEALQGDSAEVARFRSVLAHTALEKEPLRLAYSAAEHGWNARAFHSRVRNQGAAVVFAQTTGGTYLGAYNPSGWEGLGDNLDSRSAFLFTWPTGDTKQAGIKLPKVGGPGLAVMDDGSKGPMFGAEGLSIPLEPGSNPRSVQSRLGTFYANLPDGSRSLFAEGRKAELAELKVYVSAS